MTIEHKSSQRTWMRAYRPLPPSVVSAYFRMREENIYLKARLEELEQSVGEGSEDEIMIKDLTKEEAKEEIVKLFKSGRTLYYSDLVKELGIELPMVVEICDELQESNQIEIDAVAAHS